MTKFKWPKWTLVGVIILWLRQNSHQIPYFFLDFGRFRQRQVLIFIGDEKPNVRCWMFIFEILSFKVWCITSPKWKGSGFIFIHMCSDTIFNRYKPFHLILNFSECLFILKMCFNIFVFFFMVRAQFYYLKLCLSIF